MICAAKSVSRWTPHGVGLPGMILVIAVLFALVQGRTRTFAAIPSLTEDFSTTVFRDSSGTTADWNTADGALKLFPFAPTLTGEFVTPANALDVAVDGDYAFVAGSSAGLLVFDTSDLANPVLLGLYDSPGTASAVKVAGDQVFLVDGSSGLQILDVTDPALPVLLGNYNPPSSVNDVFIAGDIAYVGTSSMLRVVDISNPAIPVEIGFFNTTGFAFGVFVAGDFAYLASALNGLEVVDISNPASPFLVGSYNTPGIANHLVVAGGLAYVADGNSGLLVIDVDDPTAPTLVGSYATPSTARRVALAGDRAYVSATGAGLICLDISDPASLTLDFTFPASASINSAVVAGDHAFLADSAAGLRIARIGHLFGPEVVGSFNTAVRATGVFVDGDLAYVADLTGGLLIFDISDPTVPTPVGSYTQPNVVEHVFVSGDLAFVTTLVPYGLEILDVSDPTAPVLLGTYATTSSLREVEVVGDLAYLASPEGLLVLDVTDPANPILVGSSVGAFNLLGLEIQGDLAYAGDTFAGMIVFDISDPTAPVLAGSVVTGTNTSDLSVAGNYAFVAGFYDGMNVVDITDPANPLLVDNFNPIGRPSMVALAGDYAFLPQEEFGVYVLDVSNPTNVLPLGLFDIGADVTDIFVAGEYAYVAGDYDGLIVLKLFQSELAVDNNQGLSLAVDGTDDLIVKARLQTTQTPQVDWEVSADGGGTWESIDPGGNWVPFTTPGTDLVWRSTHTLVGANPEVGSLTLEWLNEPGRIAGITDIPNDQGRQVSLEWTRSGHDFVGDAQQIVEYAVYRKIDPGLGKLAAAAVTPSSQIGRDHAAVMLAADWHFLTTAPARAQDFYAVVVPTLADSTVAAGLRQSVFMVSGLTSTPGIFFDSPADSGYSIDNLAPSVPGGGALAGSLISWDDVADPDLDYYTVYGTATGARDGSETLIDHTTATLFDVLGADHAYYLLTATDFAGNESAAAVIANGVSEVPTGGSPRTALLGNRPNPFNPTTEIAYELGQPSHVWLRVYELSGKLVRTLASGGMRNPGPHQETWNGRDDAGRRVASGTYFYRLEAGEYSETRRMALIK